MSILSVMRLNLLWVIKVLLKVSPMKVILRFGTKGKIDLRYVGPYVVL